LWTSATVAADLVLAAADSASLTSVAFSSRSFVLPIAENSGLSSSGFSAD
jgi:hypothetical protein